MRIRGRLTSKYKCFQKSSEAACFQLMLLQSTESVRAKYFHKVEQRHCCVTFSDHYIADLLKNVNIKVLIIGYHTAKFRLRLNSHHFECSGQ